jgi:predicted porin
MKKTLIAAALAVCSTAAFAQNVTVYGTIDAAVAQKEVNGVKTTVQGNADYLGSSVLGVRGTEDLGGGLKAGFNLEGDLNVGNGTGDGTGGGLTFDRQSWVELKQNGTGVRVGRLQDIAKDSYGYGAAGMNLADLSGTTGFSTTMGQGNRHPNATQLEATLAGFRISGSYTNDTAATAAGDAQGTEASAVGIEGEITKGIKVIATTAKKGDDKGNTVGAQFAVGKAQIGALYATQDSGAGVKAKAYQVGATLPLSGSLIARASYGKNDSDTATSDATYYGVMIEKALSKRTSAYVGYSDLDVAGGTTNDTKVTTVGLQHKF